MIMLNLLFIIYTDCESMLSNIQLRFQTMLVKRLYHRQIATNTQSIDALRKQAIHLHEIQLNDSFSLGDRHSCSFRNNLNEQWR